MADERPRYRQVYSRLWHDTKVRQLSDDGKLAFLLILTAPETTPLGVAKLGPHAIAAALGWDLQRADSAVSEIAATGMIEADKAAPLIVIRNFLRWNPPNGEKAIWGWRKILNDLPECELLSDYLARIPSLVDGLSPGAQDALAAVLRHTQHQRVPDTLSDTPSDTLPDLREQRSENREQRTENRDQGVRMERASPSALPPPPRADPLEPYPELKAFYPSLMRHLVEHHPNYRVPEDGTQRHWESRKVLADLVRLDGFSETDVAGCLKWLFTSSHKDAVFWRRQVQGIKPLRVAKEAEMTKFGKIHEQWLGRNGEKVRDRACKVTYAPGDPFAIPADS